ncbi:MAG: hypothetical protein BIFFINMI_03317 [Phycisphaerae bacterium]|nr:hypothetical protein [Phycisphaerae bacterium]
MRQPIFPFTEFNYPDESADSFSKAVGLRSDGADSLA